MYVSVVYVNWYLETIIIARVVSARELRRQYSCNLEFELLHRTSVDSSIRSDYDGSCVTIHFADTERCILSESVRTSANDDWRSVDDNTCR